MELEELPTPAPGPGEAVVRVQAAGVNFIDVYRRNGAYPVELPARLGDQGAGGRVPPPRAARGGRPPPRPCRREHARRRRGDAPGDDRPLPRERDLPAEA